MVAIVLMSWLCLLICGMMMIMTSRLASTLTIHCRHAACSCWGGSKGMWWRRSSKNQFVNSNISLLKFATQRELKPLLTLESSLISKQKMYPTIAIIAITIIVTMGTLSMGGWERWPLPVIVFDHYYDHYYYYFDHHYHHNGNPEHENGGLRERWSLPLSVCWSRGLRGSTTLWSLCALCLKHTHTITQSQTHMHECKVSKGTRP